MNKRASTFLSSRGNNFSSLSKRVFFMHVCLDQFSIQRRKYSELHWFCSSSLCDESRKLAPLSQPIRCKPKPNHDFVTGVFPRFRQWAIFYLKCSLALKGILLFSDWPLWLLCQSKSVLKHEQARETLIPHCSEWFSLTSLSCAGWTTSQDLSSRENLIKTKKLYM